jgi:hypothetical protein
MKASMVAISAAANAIDGLHGAVKPVINPPGSRAKRHRQIIEALELSFSVGRHQSRWPQDLGWLFWGARWNHFITRRLVSPSS